MRCRRAFVRHGRLQDARPTLLVGTAYTIIGEIEIDGKVHAEEQVKAFNRSRPGWNFRAYHIEDEDCPIVLDLEAHRVATSKFGRRNPSFTMKD